MHDVELDASDFHVVTGVREHEGRVWLGSLEEPAVAWFDLWRAAWAVRGPACDGRSALVRDTRLRVLLLDRREGTT